MGDHQTAEFQERHGTRTLRVEIEGQVVHLTILDGNSKQYAGSTDVSDVVQLLQAENGHAAQLSSKTYAYQLSLDGEYVTLNVDPHLQVTVEDFEELFPKPEDQPS